MEHSVCVQNAMDGRQPGMFCSRLVETLAPLGDLLVRHRIAAGFGQAELARLSGLSERTLRDLERGATRRPRRHSVRALAAALGLTGPELSAFLAAAAMGPVESEARAGGTRAGWAAHAAGASDGVGAPDEGLALPVVGLPGSAGVPDAGSAAPVVDGSGVGPGAAVAGSLGGSAAGAGRAVWTGGGSGVGPGAAVAGSLGGSVAGAGRAAWAGSGSVAGAGRAVWTGGGSAAGVGLADAGRVPVAGQSGPPPDGLFLGRDKEFRSLVEMVTAGRHRLVSVTGPGGVGKSRLVAALAADVANRSWDVRTVDVSGLDDPSLLLECVAEAFGVGGPGRLEPVERLAAHLRGARAVVVVDCVEHLVAAAPDLSMLVRRCPGLSVVVTSRRPLRVSGERQLRLEPLPMPAAMALFAARAAAVAQGFEIDESNRDAVEAICRKVDGLPLAIELAAARMRQRTPAQLLGRLDGQLILLAETIASSLDSVSPTAAALFDVLGLFSGGAALDDLECVGASLGHDAGRLLEALAELVDMSLVRVGTATGDTRYSLPDTMREVALRRLGVGTSHDRVRRALAGHYLRRVGEGVLAAADADNVRAAVAWGIAHDPALFGGAVVHGLFRHYEVTGRLAEGQLALDRVGAVGRATAWVHAGHLARLRGEPAAARRYGSRALQRLSPNDHDGRCRTHLMLGSVATDLRELATSRRELHAALVQARLAGDVRLAGRVLNNLGTLAMERGRLGDAERLLLAALEAKRRGDAGDIDCGRTLFNLAETAVDDGRFEVGLLYAEKAQRLLVAGGHRRLAAFAASTAAVAHLHRGEVGNAVAAGERASALLAEGEHDDRRTPTMIDLRRSVIAHAAGDRAGAAEILRRAIPAGLDSPERDREEVAYAMEMHADLMSTRDAVSAARMLGTAGQLRSGSIRPVTPAWWTVAERASATCRERLGNKDFQSLYRCGFESLNEMCAAF